MKITNNDVDSSVLANLQRAMQVAQVRQAAEKDLPTLTKAELAELRTRAIADIDGAKAQAMNDLRGEVAQLAIGAAETVVQRNLDPATQTQLVEDYINQVAAQRA